MRVNLITEEANWLGKKHDKGEEAVEIDKWINIKNNKGKTSEVIWACD